MSNHKLYQDTFDQLELSEDTLRKVKDMSETTKMNQRKPRRVVKYAGIAAAFVATLTVGNGICYAASGNTILEQVSIYINGEKQEDQVKETVDADGNKQYAIVFDDDSKVELEENSEELRENGMSVDVDAKKGEDGTVSSEITIIDGKLEQKGDQVILTVAGTENIDVTQDIKDGTASGTVTLNGTEYEYNIQGSVKDHTISIHKK